VVVPFLDGSTDGSSTFLRERYPAVHLIHTAHNRGFAVAANLGLRWAMAQGFRYIALSNNDIKVLPGWLEPVLNLFERQEDAAAIGYLEITRNQNLPLMAPAQVRLTEVGQKLPLHLAVFDVQALDAVGLFDEAYVMYGEDLDLFRRMTRMGYRLFQSNIPVWHYGSASAGQARLRIAWLSYRNGIRYAIKNELPARIFRQTAALLYYAAIPVLRHASESRLFRAVAPTLVLAPSEQDRAQLEVKLQRLRPGHPAVNLLIWAAAVLWNLLFLPQTLLARRRDSQRIQRCLAEKRLGPAGPQAPIAGVPPK
jgi:GT2 family glycosyltransferase